MDLSVPYDVFTLLPFALWRIVFFFQEAYLPSVLIPLAEMKLEVELVQLFVLI